MKNLLKLLQAKSHKMYLSQDMTISQMMRARTFLKCPSQKYTMNEINILKHIIQIQPTESKELKWFFKIE